MKELHGEGRMKTPLRLGIGFSTAACAFRACLGAVSLRPAGDKARRRCQERGQGRHHRTARPGGTAKALPTAFKGEIRHQPSKYLGRAASSDTAGATTPPKRAAGLYSVGRSRSSGLQTITSHFLWPRKCWDPASGRALIDPDVDRWRSKWKIRKNSRFRRSARTNTSCGCFRQPATPIF